MLREARDERFALCKFEILELEARGDVAADEREVVRMTHLSGKPCSGRERALPVVPVADNDAAMVAVGVDDLHRDPSAPIVMPDFVGFQAMKRREVFGRQDVRNRRHRDARRPRRLYRDCAAKGLREEPAFGMLPKVELLH
jgi:hypothetical protein